MLENEFAKMLDDLDSLEDDFVSGYFNEESPSTKMKQELLDEIDDSNIEENDDEINFSLPNEIEEKMELLEENEESQDEMFEFPKENISFEEEKEEKTLEEKNKALKNELSWEMEVYDDLDQVELPELEATNLEETLNDKLESKEDIDKILVPNLIFTESLKNKLSSEIYSLESNNSNIKEETNEDELDQETYDELETTSEKEEPVYQNRFTSFSKSHLSKIYHKKIKVDRNAKFKSENEKTKNTFSYNDILDRLDNKRKLDLNNVNDLMKIIDKCNNYKEFFEIADREFHGKK